MKLSKVHNFDFTDGITWRALKVVSDYIESFKEKNHVYEIYMTPTILSPFQSIFMEYSHIFYDPDVKGCLDDKTPVKYIDEKYWNMHCIQFLYIEKKKIDIPF